MIERQRLTQVKTTRVRSKYKEEREIRRLAIYYVGSGFNEEYVEELYPKIRFLANRIARKYYKLSDELDIDEVTHKATTEVLMNLRDKKIKPDLEAWTRYIMVRVRKFLPHRSDYKGHNHLFSSTACYTIDDNFDFSKFEDPVKQEREIEYRIDLRKIVSDYTNKTTFFERRNSDGIKNLILYLLTASLFELKQLPKVLIQFDETIIPLRDKIKNSLKELIT